MSTKNKIAITVVLLGLLGSIYFVYEFLKPKGIEVSRKSFEVQGIDISFHCGKIDFAELNKGDIDFILMKSSEGTRYVDPRFREYYRKASQYSWPIGFYHFFRFNKPGKQQAIHFWNLVKDKEYQLPLAIDVEEWGNDTKIPVSRVVKNVQEFIHYIEKKTGKEILIYSNENTYKRYLRKKFGNKPVWICSFYSKRVNRYPWKFWQFSHKGKVRGVKNLVDLNAFNGNRKQWKQYLKQWD